MLTPGSKNGFENRVTRKKLKPFSDPKPEKIETVFRHETQI